MSNIYLNCEPVMVTKFPAGELNITAPITDLHDFLLEATLSNSDDIIALCLTVNAIRKTLPQASIDLHLPYIPYGRQDRVCNEGEALSIEVMAGIINSLKVNTVNIIDPHSDVTPALINNCLVTNFCEWADDYDLFIHSDPDTIFVAPDAGAEKRTLQVARKFNCSMVTASKVRDTKTGNITGTQVHHQGNLSGKSLCVLDDICDGGRTFIELAKKLKEYNPESLHLYVTHGVFSKGLDELLTYYDTVTCYHDFNKNIKQENYTCIKTH